MMFVYVIMIYCTKGHRYTHVQMSDVVCLMKKPSFHSDPNVVSTLMSGMGIECIHISTKTCSTENTIMCIIGIAVANIFIMLSTIHTHMEIA